MAAHQSRLIQIGSCFPLFVLSGTTHTLWSYVPALCADRRVSFLGQLGLFRHFCVRHFSLEQSFSFHQRRSRHLPHFCVTNRDLGPQKEEVSNKVMIALLPMTE